MKFQGPKDTGGASIGGQFFPADENGVIEVPDDGEYASALAPHGFYVMPPEAAPAAEGAKTKKSKKADSEATEEAAPAAEGAEKTAEA